MDEKGIKKLLLRYTEGKCSEEERMKIETWCQQLGKDFQTDLSESEIEKDLLDIHKQLPLPATKHYISWRRYAAAIVLLILAGGVYFYSTQSKHFDEGQTAQQHILRGEDIAPGGNKATLTLADGTEIQLDEVAYGSIAKQADKMIYKSDDGQIVYKVNDQKAAKLNSTLFNTISTPRGGQYNVTLPDGTRVWLNAESSLTYATTTNEKERMVELVGEGYFEVAKDLSRPFKVITNKQTVEVLGTHFNINSYTDEPSIKTTLVEGSVKIVENINHSSIILKPGQQASLGSNSKLKVSKMNIEDAIAWKSGLFRFENADIESIMRQLSRWYDVEVKFEGKKPDFNLWGEVYRGVNASQALEILTYFNLKYRFETKDGIKKIIIYS